MEPREWTSERLDFRSLWRGYEPTGTERRAPLSPLEAELVREQALSSAVEAHPVGPTVPAVRPSVVRRVRERPAPGECLAIALLCLLTPPVLLWVYAGGPEWLGRLLEGR